MFFKKNYVPIVASTLLMMMKEVNCFDSNQTIGNQTTNDSHSLTKLQYIGIGAHVLIWLTLLTLAIWKLCTTHKVRADCGCPIKDSEDDKKISLLNSPRVSRV